MNNFLLYSLLTDKNYHDNNLNESCLVLKPPKNFKYLFNEFQNFSSDINNTRENIINSKYYDFNQLEALKEFTYKSSLSLIHLNTCCLKKDIDDLEHLIQSTMIVFDITVVAESRLLKNKLPNKSPYYSYEF